LGREVLHVDEQLKQLSSRSGGKLPVQLHNQGSSGLSALIDRTKMLHCTTVHGSRLSMPALAAVSPAAVPHTGPIANRGCDGRSASRLVSFFDLAWNLP
jgi:hypothetical protein